MSSTRAVLPPTDRFRALKDIIDRMVDAHDDNEFEFVQAIFALHKLFGGEEGEWWDAEIEWCSFSVLCQMYKELDNKRSQKRGRVVLRTLENSRELYYAPSYLLPVRDAIVEFIETHAGDASAARFGFELISRGEIPNLDTLGDWDVSQNTVNVAVDCMVRHKNDPAIQEYAMLSICGADDELDVDYQEVLDVCLEAMHNHPDNSNVQVAACDALCLFRETYELITRIEWPPATILQALNSHVHCAEVQTSACACLRYLLGGVQDARDYIEANLPTLVGEDFFLAVQDYIEAILQALQNHPTNERVQCVALDVLESMTNDSASLNRIIQGGGVDLLIRAMRTFGEADVDVTPVRILKPLLGYSTDARREAIELGAIPILIDVLLRLPYGTSYETSREKDFYLSRSISTCIIVCDALNELFLENIDNAVSLQIANEGGIKLIVDSVIKHVRPGCPPPSGNINCTLECLELKDGDILAHLAMLSDNDGKLPLHHAADRDRLHFKGQLAVLEHLLKAYPEAATVRDGNGRLPLHIAIESKAPLSVLEVLLRAIPNAGEAVCQRRDDTMLNFPPVLMAAASDCDLECIFALLRCDPTITKRQVTFVSRKRKSPPS